MAFPDFPFANQQKSFLHHSEVNEDIQWILSTIKIFSKAFNQVLEYLEQYAEAHLLHKYIQFSTQVYTNTRKWV